MHDAHAGEPFAESLIDEVHRFMKKAVQMVEALFMVAILKPWKLRLMRHGRSLGGMGLLLL